MRELRLSEVKPMPEDNTAVQIKEVMSFYSILTLYDMLVSLCSLRLIPSGSRRVVGIAQC